METVIDSKEIPEGTQFIESGCGKKGFRKFEKGCWWFFEGFWRHVDWKMGTLTLVTEHPDYAAPAPAPWTGEGLPPAGIEIEALLPGIGNTTYFWQRAKVVHGALPDSPGEVLVFSLETTRPAWSDEFRPIRTPEQIAAEEHRKAVEQLAADTDWILPKEACEAVLAAGYRKQVTP